MKPTLLLILAIAFPCYAGEGLATYYTADSCVAEGNSGVKTASGKDYDENGMTCAMRSRKWGSKWRVTNLNTKKSIKKSIIVTLTDFGPGRGPAARGVIIDLTPKAFQELGGGKHGEIRVKVERVPVSK